VKRSRRLGRGPVLVVRGFAPGIAGSGSDEDDRASSSTAQAQRLQISADPNEALTVTRTKLMATAAADLQPGSYECSCAAPSPERAERAR